MAYVPKYVWDRRSATQGELAQLVRGGLQDIRNEDLVAGLLRGAAAVGHTIGATAEMCLGPKDHLSAVMEEILRRLSSRQQEKPATLL